MQDVRRSNARNSRQAAEVPGNREKAFPFCLGARTKEEGTGMTQRCFATGSGHSVHFLFISVSVATNHRLDHDACRIAFAFPPSSTKSIVATRATENKFHDLARVTLARSLHSALTRMAPILRMLYAARNNEPACSYAMCTSPKPTHIFRISGRKWITEALGTVHVECRGIENSDLTTPSCWNGIKTNP